MRLSLQLAASFLLFQALLPAHAADPVQRVFAVWDVSDAGHSSRPRNQIWTVKVQGWDIATRVVSIPVNPDGFQILAMRPPGESGSLYHYLAAPSPTGAPPEVFRPPGGKSGSFMCAYLDSTARGVRTSRPVITIVSHVVDRPGISERVSLYRPLFFQSPEDCRNLDPSRLPLPMPYGPKKMQSW